jgi:GNAT superfamily N-acetyltransferase
LETEPFTIRRARPDDAEQIALFRRLMFAEMRDFSPAVLQTMEADYRLWVRDRLERGLYFGWLVIADNTSVVGSAGIWLMEWLPHPADLTCQRGHVVDVYVKPDYRRQGLARRLMETLLAWCEDRGMVMVTLYASTAGEHLYRSLGFDQTNFFSKTLSVR